MDITNENAAKCEVSVASKRKGDMGYMISHLSTPADAASAFFPVLSPGTSHGDKFEKGRRKLLYKQLVTHHRELNFFLSKNKHFLQRYSCYIKGLKLIGGRKREDIKKMSTETME